MATPVASCWAVPSGSGGLLVPTVGGSACALVLKAAAVSTSKIALFNFRLPLFRGWGFVTGRIVPDCCIWVLGLVACAEAPAGMVLSLAPVGVAWSFLPEESGPLSDEITSK